MSASSDQTPVWLDKVIKAVSLYNRGTANDHDLTDQLLEALKPWEPDKRALAVGMLTLLAQAEYPTPVLRLACLFAGPDTVRTLDPLVDRELARAEDEPEIPNSLADLALAVVGRRPLPGTFLQTVSVKGEPTLASLLSLLDALRECDRDRVQSLVTYAARHGCVGPLRTAMAFERPALSSAECLETIACFDLASLRSEGRWGAIAACAALAARHCAFDLALSWSGAVEDEHLVDGKPGLCATSHGWGCDSACSMISSQLLGVLATVDWVCGEHERAVQRARSFSERDDGRFPSAVERALTQWVLAQAAPSAARYTLLAKIGDADDWLGLLAAQVAQDKADLCTDPDAAAVHTQARDHALARPQPRLHFGAFDFDDVLWALPVARHPA